MAGPPTPAAAFISPLVKPRDTMGTGPLARHELRVSRCEASSAMMRRMPMQISSGASATLLANQAPGKTPARAASASPK
jgi:hypothetical protein